MDKFYALAAPIRREIIDLLSTGEQLTATAIAEQFQLTPPAISQHLRVLLDCKLVRMHKEAQRRIYELNPIAIAEVEAWASQIAVQLSKLNPIKLNEISEKQEAA